MFGENLDFPKYVKPTRSKTMTHDIQLPTIKPGIYGHMGRAPNTDHHVRLFEYRRRLNDAETHFLAAEAKRLTKEAVAAKYDKHTEQKKFRRDIQERFKEKVKVYEESIDRRREKLKELLCREEEEYIVETIDKAQKGVDSKMQEMKEKAQLLKAQREAERQEIVNQKCMQRYMDECKELRPVLVKRNLIDTKNTQLQQIKENEMRREAEKELDNLWYDLMVKEQETKMEREAQDLFQRNQMKNEIIETWQKQIQGKQLMKQESEQLAAEDRLELLKLQDQLRREEIEALDAKRRKRDRIANELREQIAVQEKYMAQRKKEEDALSNAMSHLARVELEREKQKIQDTTLLARRETMIYRQHLRELDEERKQEERQLNQLLEEHQKIILKKQEDAFCKLKKAREDLQRNVLAGRAEQLEYKRLEAENQLKLKEAENELCRMACETNERLQAEHDRQQAEQEKQYRDDLKKQIDYNNEKRKLEREQLERELAEGLAEEERHRQHVLKLIATRMEAEAFKHPFRVVLEKPTCPCPDNPTDNH